MRDKVITTFLTKDMIASRAFSSVTDAWNYIGEYFITPTIRMMVQISPNRWHYMVTDQAALPQFNADTIPIMFILTREPISMEIDPLRIDPPEIQ